jgi:glycosyltransferase involved in cell wall biosynthesis
VTPAGLYNDLRNLSMNSLPKITLVMPSYNQAAYLETAICSVLEQHYPNLEFMIMDGGSSDSSLDIIKRYSSHLSYWISQPDEGQADALKQGLARATGVFLGWLNSDDVLLPGALKQIAQANQAHPEGSIFAGNILWIDQNDHIIRCKRHPSSADFFSRRGVFIIAQPGSFFKRADYEAVGGINSSLRYVMDADLYIRLLANGSRHVHLNTWQAAFRLQSVSKTVSESVRFAEEYEQTRIHDWPSMRPSQTWKLLYKGWQIINGNFIRMGFETMFAHGKKWQDWVNRA